ncbi:hypothetical protein RsTz2092_09840 [Deferribacterales bacterium RsTz2092]|nr:hypothetical protein AGMMS49941_03280 [Deferribacterales bacterium]
MHKVLLICIILLSLTTCSKDFEPSILKLDNVKGKDNQYSVPAECSEYLSNANGKVINVAVLNFANKTAYSDSKISSELGNNIRRAFVALGGYNVIDTESVVRKGKITDRDDEALAAALGADYLVNGSIDNFRALLAANSCDESGKCTYRVTIDVTLKVTKVKTSEQVYKKTSHTYFNAAYTDREVLTDEKMIGLVSSALNRYFRNLITDELLSAVPVRAYVVQLRGGKKAALINATRDSGIREGMLFRPYSVSVETEYVTGKSYCHLTPMPFTLKASKYINDTGTWLEVGSASGKVLKQLNVGTIVQRIVSDKK